MDHLSTVEAENGLRDMAHLTWVFYRQLRDEGFDRREAMILTVHWMRNTIGGSE